jgi:hypothetical protein
VVRAIVASIAGVFLALTASAHDPEGRWDDWFVLQRNMRGGSCCNVSHAHYLKDEDWRNGDRHYQVRIKDRWYDIEDWQMLKPADPNPTGHAVLWYNDIGGTFLIYCFTPSRET